jgi:hypothetical protein
MGRRSAIVTALAIAGALGVAGIALGAGDSTATLEFGPDRVPKDTYRKGSLFVHTHTDYTLATKTSRAQLNFDDDIKLNTQGVPRCDASDVSGNQTLQQAMNNCGTARVGSGRAEANLATPGDVKGCVLTFNAQDGNPSVGGNQPGILLFTRLKFPPIGTFSCANPASNGGGDVTVLLQGALKGASGDFGTQLDVNNIPQTLALSDFMVTVKRGSYVSARCHDADRRWNLRTKFTYTNPSSTQTVNDSQTCEVSQAVGPPDTKITKSKVSQRRHKAKFKFKAKGTATGFECKLRGKGHKKGFRSCDSPKKYKHLKKGKYTFKVRAVGPGGKDPSPAKKRFKIKRR